MYISIVLALGMVLTIPVSSVLGSDNITSHNKSERPAINPDFAPDESCLFGYLSTQMYTRQEYPEPQFGTNEDYACFPKTPIDGKWEWECPEDHHSREYDGTGQCYPDSEGCVNGIII